MTVGQYRSAGTTLTDAQVAKLQLDSTGNLKTVNVAGSAIIGKVAIDQTTPGTTNLVAVAGNAGAVGSFNAGADGFGAASSSGLYTLGFGLVFNGTTWDRARGDTNGQAMQKGLGGWTYASGTIGILSNTTTAVTVKTAAGASVRNFIDSIQITTTAFTASVPIAIRDGAGGSVIWSAVVPTTGWLQPVTIVFETPLRSTANTLLEIVTTTANTAGTAMVNIQGHTGT